MENKIDQFASVHPEAKIGKGVEIGPFCVIGPDVEIGDECKLYSHVVVDGMTKIGKRNQFYQFTSIGAPPQDSSYKFEPTAVEIGDENIFREYVSVHRGTIKQDKKTIIGSKSLFMASSHVAHDCILGDGIVLANGVMLAGHVNVNDRVIMGGSTAVSQFVTIGKGSYIGGGSAIDRDIPHYCTALGNRVRLKGINIIGLKRQGWQKQEISEVVDFYRTMESSALAPRGFVENQSLMNEFEDNKIIREISDFIKQSQIGIAPFMGG